MNAARIIVTISLLALLFLDAEWLGANRESTAFCLLAFCALGLSAVACALLFQAKEARLSFNRIHLILLGSIFFLALTTYRAGPWYLSEYYLVRFSLLFLVLLFLYQEKLMIGLGFLQRLFSVSLISVGLIWLFAVLYGLQWGRVDLGLESGLAFTFGNRNHFAAYLVLALFMSLPLFFKAEALKARIFYGCSLLVGVLLIYLSGSRNALLQLLLFGPLAFCLIIWILFAGHSAFRRILLGILIGWALVAVLIGLSLPDFTRDKLFSVWQNASDMQRLTAWSAVLHYVTESIPSMFLGKGAGFLFAHAHIFPTEHLQFGMTIAGNKYAHNEYLELLMEGGIVLVLLFGAAVLILSRSLIRKIRDQKLSPQIRVDLASMLIALLALALFAFFSVAPRYSSVLFPLVLVFGIAINTADFRRYQLSRRLSLVGSILFLLITAFCSVFAAKRLLADHHYRAFVRVAESWHQSAIEEEIEITPQALVDIQKRSNYHMGEGLRHNPEHIHLLYRKHEQLIAGYGGASRPDVQAVFNQIDALIPNFAGLWTKQAEYLISQGDMESGIELAESAAGVNNYNIDLEIRLGFYHLLNSDRQAFNGALERAVGKAIEAEMRFGQAKGRINSSGLASERKLVLEAITNALQGAEQITLFRLRQDTVSQLRLYFDSTYGIDAPVFLQFFEEQANR